jgi:hypothetical protein
VLLDYPAEGVASWLECYVILLSIACRQDSFLVEHARLAKERAGVLFTEVSSLFKMAQLLNTGGVRLDLCGMWCCAVACCRQRQRVLSCEGLTTDRAGVSQRCVHLDTPVALSLLQAAAVQRSEVQPSLMLLYCLYAGHQKRPDVGCLRAP